MNAHAFCLAPLIAFLAGCQGAVPKVTSASYSVRTDASGLAEKIHIQDTTGWNFRWVEIPRVASPQRIGPTDSRLLVFAARKDSKTPRTLDDQSNFYGEFGIPLEIADSLLPLSVRNAGKRDSPNFLIRDTLRRPPFRPMAWYGEGVAIHIGRYLLMEFDSH